MPGDIISGASNKAMLFYSTWNLHRPVRYAVTNFMIVTGCPVQQNILFKLVHENIGILRYKSDSHGCSVCLVEELAVKSEDIVVEDEADEFKTKELIIDFGKKGGEHVPIYINRAEVERFESVKFLVVTITNNLSWASHV
eukprot:g40257.t1